MNPSNENPILLVPPYIRYQSAWQEINARIQSRQFILGTYMSGAVVALIIGLPGKDSQFLEIEKWNMLAVILLPLLSFAVALWSQHNDAIIGLLSSYCQHFEKEDDPDLKKGIPGWHDSRYLIIEAALNYRRNSDWAFIIIATLSCIPALLILLNDLRFINFQNIVDLKIHILPFIVLLVGIISIIIAYLNTNLRAKIKNNWTFSKNEAGEYIWGWEKK